MKVIAKRIIPDRELSTNQLIQRLKYEYPQEGVKLLYIKFVARRQFKPEIDASEFAKILESVHGDPHFYLEERSFYPTHFDYITGMKVQVIRTEYGHSLVFANSMIGHEPGKLANRYIPLEVSHVA